MKRWLNNRSIPQLIALGFLSCILIGSLLLWLPFSSNSGHFTPYLDALFTATSAICVTGQTTLDIISHWNYFGKTVILIMIEIGGLGFMSIMVLLFAFMGRKLTLTGRKIIKDSLNHYSIQEAQALVTHVIRFALAIQIGGAVLLATDFIPRFGTAQGIYFAIFHSISSFCNAGMSLFADSLTQFQTNPLVLFTIMALIVVGGLGFVIWNDIFRRKLSRHSQLTLITTGILLVVGFILFAIGESKNNTFAQLPLASRWLNYLFMTVSPRSAGYHNIDYNLVSQLSIFTTLVLAFIGGSSGSTAGGIKVSTVAVLFIAMRYRLKGEQPRYRHRGIATETINRALMITAVGIIMTAAATLILLITETVPPSYGIEYILIDVVSCFGTVGLSMGLIQHLSSIGKVVIIILMFAGRIGLLTFILSFNTKYTGKETSIKYPTENIMIG